MSDPIVITRELVKRGWSDFEPKLITGLLTGSVAAFIVSLLGQYGVHLSAMQDSFLSVGCFFVGGYLTPSTGTAVTKRISAGVQEVEQHSGQTITTITGPTPIQTPSGAFTKVLSGDDTSKPTEVLAPPYSRGGSILDQLPSAQQES